MLKDSVHGRATSTFTLQWHLTHACDLRCKHCYDRTLPRVMRLEQGISVLDQLGAFCEARGVRGTLCLSGGNPFFYPWFFELYEEAAHRGYPISILGNPVSAASLAQLVSIKKPTYFQVSLEGLREHNDRIRGAGFFDRVLEFLPLLREQKIDSAVMLTLTRDNMEQIVPLAELLRGKADRVTFNRLSPVGEGASLALPDTEAYGRFMIDYLVARKKNRALHIKDNLFNIFAHELGIPLFRGCTGFGCGAAFNFVAVLPTGEVHACRKFPSPLGNIFEEGLAAIYDSPAAARYRRGCSACDGCPIRSRCGGCLAVASGLGRAPFEERDPHCFM